MSAAHALDGFRSRDGLQIAARRWPAPGVPLYLMHATGFCAAVWEPIARALCAVAEPRAMDERGHGASDKPEGNYPWSLFADDLLDWIASERAARCFAMGHSAGATAVLLAAAARPHVLERILLVDPVLLPPPPERDAAEQRGGFGLADRTARRRGSFSSRDEARALLGKRFPYSTFDAEVLELYLAHGFEDQPDGSVRLRCPPAIESRIYLGTAAVDPWEVLPQIRARTRILLPERSGTRPQLQARLASALPAAELVRLTGSHFVPLERPALVAAQALEFFA